MEASAEAEDKLNMNVWQWRPRKRVDWVRANRPDRPAVPNHQVREITV